jgi:hypothetical protein
MRKTTNKRLLEGIRARLLQGGACPMASVFKGEVGEKIKKISAVVWSVAICLASTLAYASEDSFRTVAVPAIASGNFGFGGIGGFAPLVKAIAIRSAGTITIQYLSGTCCISFRLCGIGPNGIQYSLDSRYGTPLQEVLGLVFGSATNVGALIGAFVPEPLVNTSGFEALDETKLVSGVGITPKHLFLVGTYNVISVSAGTLYLGINDSPSPTNSGSLVVTVTATPNP